MKPLFVYGTLQPGHANAHILENIGGKWLAGTVNGRFFERGWGEAADFPGILLDRQAGAVPGYLFFSDNLTPNWPMLDAFEAGYDRVDVDVTAGNGEKIGAWIYQLQPQQA